MKEGTAIERLSVERFITAIDGCKGIKIVVCERVPCAFDTFTRWMAKHPTIRVAFEHECNKTLGLCHSAVVKNIELEIKAQEDEGKPINLDDIKWYLARRGRAEGWGADPAISIEQHIVTVADFRAKAKERLAQVEDL